MAIVRLPSRDILPLVKAGLGIDIRGLELCRLDIDDLHGGVDDGFVGGVGGYWLADFGEGVAQVGVGVVLEEGFVEGVVYKEKFLVLGMN